VDENVVIDHRLFITPDQRFNRGPEHSLYHRPTRDPRSHARQRPLWIDENGSRHELDPDGRCFPRRLRPFRSPGFANLGCPRSGTRSSLPSAMADRRRIAAVLRRGVHLVPLLRGLWFYFYSGLAVRSNGPGGSSSVPSWVLPGYVIRYYST